MPHRSASILGAYILIAETRFGRDHQTLRIWTTQLYLEFDNLCYQYRLRLKKPVVRILDKVGQWGSWDPNTRTICISRKLIEIHSWDAVIEVLKHEIAHMIVNEEFNIPDHTHGDNFKRAAKMIGASSWASATDADLENMQPGFKTRVLADEDEKLLKRAQKLLALAESSNENEAYLAMKRVRELYSRFNIERLSKNSSDDYEYRIINKKKKRIPQHHSMIASILTSHFFVDVVYSSIFDAKAQTSFKILEIIGTKQNVELAEYVFDFLENNLTLLWESYKKKHSNQVVRAKRSFFLGVLNGFDEKLRKEATISSPAGQTWSLIDNSSASTSALIKSADIKLRSFVSNRHPKLVTKGWRSSYSDPASYDQGKSEGQRLSLNRPITQKSSGETRYLNP